jgi:hypothetical protein
LIPQVIELEDVSDFMTTTSTRDEMIKVLVFPFNIVFMTLLDAFQQQLTVGILTTPNCPVKMMMVQKCNIFINDPKTFFLNIERPQKCFLNPKKNLETAGKIGKKSGRNSPACS